MPNFTPDQALDLLADTINLSVRHSGYLRTIQLREDYLTVATGKGWPRFLSRFRLRTSEAEYLQQLEMTHQNLSSTSSLLEKKFAQISRVQDIKKGINFEGTSNRDQQDLLDVLNDFGGEGSAQRGSLDDYLTLVYDRIALYDPNAFILYDFAPFMANLGERARPYGVVFTCPNVLNFRYTRGDLDYLLVQVVVSFKNPDGLWKTATDYLIFCGAFSLRYYELADGRRDVPVSGDVFEATSGTLYRIASFAPGVIRVPAVRLGYVPDIETQNLTCVSPAFHPAMDLFRELIDLKSLNDIVTKKHGYPQRFKQSPPCPGELDAVTGFRDVCRDGWNMNKLHRCQECGGSGFLEHKSEQDTITRQLPENTEDWADLSKLVFTVKPELETITTFDEKIENKKIEIIKTIFSSDQQVQVSGPAKTATEYTVSREDQNNTLLPFADQKSAVYKDSVQHIAALMSISGIVKPLYEFSRDLRLSTIADLEADLKAARDAGAPDFEIEQILDDIARKRYESDPVALERYFIKKQHIPYFALSLASFEYAYAESLMPKAMAVLYFNSDIVFGELELEQPGFYELDYAKRDSLVTAKVDALMAELPQPVTMSGIPKPGQQQQP